MYHEDFVNIRERLGWEEPKEARLQADKELTLQLGYSWVPPGLSADKVCTMLPRSLRPKPRTPCPTPLAPRTTPRVPCPTPPPPAAIHSATRWVLPSLSADEVRSPAPRAPRTAPHPTPHAPRPTSHAPRPTPHAPCLPLLQPYTQLLVGAARPQRRQGMQPAPHAPRPTPHAPRLPLPQLRTHLATRGCLPASALTRYAVPRLSFFA